MFLVPLASMIRRGVGSAFLLVLLLAGSPGMALHATDGKDAGQSHVTTPRPTQIRPLPDISMVARLDRPDLYNLLPVDQMPTTTEKWIEVDLSEQRVTAYEGVNPVRIFTVSSGLPRWPTVTGTFRIRAKTSSQVMEGGDRAAGDYYYLPNVQWVSYFFEDYAFHGTYWHNRFGQPMSHGCVNMTNEDAEWLFFWSGPHWDGEDWLKSSEENPGTLVFVHP